MTSELETPQIIDPSLDEETVRLLSMAQNGTAALHREEDADGKVTLTSRYSIDLTGYVKPANTPAVQRLLDYASAKQNAILGLPWSFNVAASGDKPHVVTTRLDANGQLSMMKLALWLQINASKASTARLPYNNVDSSSDSLTFAEVDELVTLTGAFDIKSYDIFNPVCDQIRAGTMTTTAEIDAALSELKP